MIPQSIPQENIAEPGKWKIFGPVIDKAICSDCGWCITYCPDGAITKGPVIDDRFCKGCGICANECPKKAIDMREI